jgi:molybdenum cofactor cytidylyltransferase
MNLVRALRLDNPRCIAFVGAGGKTSAMFQLARQYSPPVILTTTTHVATWQANFADRHYQVNTDADIEQIIGERLSEVILLTGLESENKRLSGLKERQLEKVYKFARAAQIPLLIEADGSRQRAVKAPDIHEPVIPNFVDLVVVVAGLSALGKPLDEHWVHRPLRYSHISGLSIGEKITSSSLVSVLKHPKGGMKGIPGDARIVALLNQADSQKLQSKGKSIADHLLPAYQSVLIASLTLPTRESGGQQNIVDHIHEGSDRSRSEVFAVIERVAGVVLAAGGSVRMGQPKQLLMWRNKTFIEHVISIAKDSGLWPIVVVSGAYSDQIKKVIEPMSVQIVNNMHWKVGQSTSLLMGLEALPPDIGAAVFLLVDQPQIEPRLIQNLVEEHAVSLAPIVAPLIDGQRGNPVLFDKVTFPELMSLHGDIGGRGLFSRYKTHWVKWLDSDMLYDVDTQEDYHRLIRSEDENK